MNQEKTTSETIQQRVERLRQIAFEELRRRGVPEAEFERKPGGNKPGTTRDE